MQKNKLIPTSALLNKDLSLSARGLYATVYTICEAKILPDAIVDAIFSNSVNKQAWNELSALGYIHRIEHQYALLDIPNQECCFNDTAFLFDKEEFLRKIDYYNTAKRLDTGLYGQDRALMYPKIVELIISTIEKGEDLHFVSTQQTVKYADACKTLCALSNKEIGFVLSNYCDNQYEIKNKVSYILKSLLNAQEQYKHNHFFE